MCGRFVSTTPPEEMAKILALVETPLVDQRYNVAPSQLVPVVRITKLAVRISGPAKR